MVRGIKSSEEFLLKKAMKDTTGGGFLMLTSQHYKSEKQVFTPSQPKALSSLMSCKV